MTQLWTWAWLLISLATPPETIDHEVDRILSQLSLEQKIGQLMMIGFGGKEMGPEIEALLKKFHVGAVAIYSRNVRNPEQVARLIQDIGRVMADEVPPFVAIDQEGGNVVRLRSQVAVLPGTMTLGATRDPILAYLAGQAQGVDLGLVGFTMNLAPVLDTNVNPNNPVINVRAFGDHYELVAKLGQAFIRGQQAGGMTTVAKHFPGHGGTDHDSHFSLPRIDKDIDQLMQTELVPFRQAIHSGLDAIMTAHVQVPAVDPEGTPASLSQRVIGGLLREKLGFDGVVITDDLEMRAVSEKRGVGPAAVQAILAGADMVMVIWTPRRKEEVFNSLRQAVEEGTIPPARLRSSLRRILRLKIKRELFDRKRPPIDEAFSLLPNPYHQQVARTIALRGTTLVTNHRSLVPLCSGSGLVVATPYAQFGQIMAHNLPGTEVMHLRLVSSRKQREKELDRLLDLARGKRVVVIGVANAYQAALVQAFTHRSDVPVVVASFGSPYLLHNFPKVAGYLCTYSYQPAALEAAALALTGRASITGRLPVTLSRQHRRGEGLTISRDACGRPAAASR